MMQAKLIPDGMERLPAEARDDGIIAAHLENAGDGEGGPPWDEVRRVKAPDHILLQVDAGPDDHPGAALDALVQAVASNINGVKAHPAGWTEVDEGL